MSTLIKTINKFNGNLCFVGATDAGDIIFECDRQNETLSYALSSKLITDVCLNNEASYLVVFGNEWLGLFSNGVLNETYINTGISAIHKIIKSTDANYYAFNKNTNQLIKFTIGG